MAEFNLNLRRQISFPHHPPVMFICMRKLIVATLGYMSRPFQRKPSASSLIQLSPCPKLRHLQGVGVIALLFHSWNYLPSPHTWGGEGDEKGQVLKTDVAKVKVLCHWYFCNVATAIQSFVWKV